MRIILATILSLCLSLPALADDSYEPNNDFSSAKTIALSTHALTAQDDDWFKITTNPELLYLKMDYTTGTGLDLLNVVLYNSSNQAVKNNFAQSSEEF